MSKTKTAAPKKVAATKSTATKSTAATAKKAAPKAAASVTPAAKPAVKKTAAKKAAPAKKAPAAKAGVSSAKAPAKAATKVAAKKTAATKAPAKAASTAARKTESVTKPVAPAKTAAKLPWSHSSPGTLLALKAVANALLDKKAGDLRILHLGHRSSLTDFIVIATGLAETHLRALHIESEKAFDLLKYPIIGIDRQTDSGWVVVDAADIMVHIFTEEKRGFYALESNWKDAESVTLAQLG